MSGKLIPERLTAVRKALGIRKADAARLIGVSETAYGRYERGARAPSFSMLQTIARVTGTSVEYLVGASDEMGPVHLPRRHAGSSGIAEAVRPRADADAAAAREQRLGAYYGRSAKGTEEMHES